MRVSCIIPAYNEAATIPAVVRAARACPDVDEVIVVSDGSTDETARRAEEAGADRVIALPRNQGKGGAVLVATQQASGDVILLLDADLCGLRPADLSRLLAPVLKGEVDMSVVLFAGDPWHGLMHRLSGQRALQRHLLQHPEALAGTGFGFELALHRVAKKERARVVRVPLAGVTHRRKREKYGTVKGLRLQMKASSDLWRQARGVMTRHDAGPRTVKERPRSMGAVLLVLVLLLVIAGPIFLTHPSHAARVSALSPLQPTDRLLIAVAHPDDEIIGAGGLIATARRAGVPVSVLVLTNGDSNRVSAALIGRHVRPRPTDFIRTGGVRQRETVEGLRRLGVPPDQIFFMGFPDRGLAQVLRSKSVALTSPYTGLSRASYPWVVGPDAAYTAEELGALVRRVIEQVRPTVIITHAPFDRHSDHQATYALMSQVQGKARLYAFLVHAPDFPRPLRSAPKEPLLPPATLASPAGWSWVEFALSAEAQFNKQQALNAHRSQIQTPYLRLLLASFVRKNELFALPQAVDPFTLPYETTR
jgi:LmbE family N-acetylglucosaminyl deacetylase/CTP:molybdopterin cytidylyltransferase MocA